MMYSTIFGIKHFRVFRFPPSLLYFSSRFSLVAELTKLETNTFIYKRKLINNERDGEKKTRKVFSKAITSLEEGGKENKGFLFSDRIQRRRRLKF